MQGINLTGDSDLILTIQKKQVYLASQLLLLVVVVKEIRGDGIQMGMDTLDELIKRYGEEKDTKSFFTFIN